MTDHAGRTRAAAMLALVVAGELIFSLPFHVPRYFRPSTLAAFGLSNAQLGDIFAVYGVTAMLAYVPGGLLADRFSARKLMATSLAATAAGGLYMATLPDLLGMHVLYGYLGITTIFLFWSPMIRATRTWGGDLAQGRAFGILDGGRGLVAAVFAAVAVWVFGGYMSDATLGGVDLERRAGMHAVILVYSALTFLSGLLVLRFVPDDTLREARSDGIDDLRAVVRLRVVWLQALVVVCAYCGYKGLDNYALYAFQVLGLDETAAARFAAAGASLRPLAAIAAVFLADRLGVARVIAGLFAALIGFYAFLALPQSTAAFDTFAYVYADLALTMFAVFALRGVYFALLEETDVPHVHTGAAVGFVSFIGFTPDVFFGAIAGRLLDASPGAPGHRHYFLMLAAIAVVGLIAALLLAPRARDQRLRR